MYWEPSVNAQGGLDCGWLIETRPSAVAVYTGWRSMVRVPASTARITVTPATISHLLLIAAHTDAAFIVAPVARSQQRCSPWHRRVSASHVGTGRVDAAPR